MSEVRMCEYVQEQSHLFITEQFKKDVKKLNSKKLEENVEEILNQLSYLLENSPSQIKMFLKKYKSKPILGRDGFRKFYTTSSHRVIYTDGKTIGKMNYSNSIFILRYVDNHNLQIIKAKNTNVHLSNKFYLKAYKKTEIQDIIDIRDLEKVYRIEQAAKGQMLDNQITYYVPQKRCHEVIFRDDVTQVLLNSEQESWQRFIPPLTIKGNAGSGKTLVSLNIMKELSAQNKKAVYITFTDDLKYFVTEELKKWGECSTHNYYSIHEFYMELLNLEKEKYIDYPKFLAWYKMNCYASNFNPKEVWTEIRAFIKGFMNIDWDRKISCHNKLSLSEYKLYCEKYSIFNEDKIERIYTIANKYTEWLNENNYFDDNDLACNIISKCNKKQIKQVDYLVVDEVQDLTDMQIESILKLTKNYNVYFCGDQNQIINPTLFDFKRLSTCLYKKINKNDNKYTFNSNTLILKNNYRSNSKIVDYINNVSLIRQKYIGHQKFEDDLEERAIKIDNSSVRKIYNILDESSNIERIIDLFENQPSVAIIVLSDEIRDSLKSKYNSNALSIYSVNEIKGLEFKHVLCYKLISSMQDIWKKIFSGEAKKDFAYKYYFNLFYVSISRAKEYLYFIEDSDTTVDIKKKLFDFPLIEEVSEDFFEHLGSVAPEEWLSDGNKFEKAGDYKRAISAYENYEKMTYDRSLINSKRCKGKLYKFNQKYLEAGNCFIESGEYESAYECFKVVNEKNMMLKSLLEIIDKEPNHKLKAEILKLVSEVDIDKEILNSLVNRYLNPIINEYREINSSKLDTVINNLKGVFNE